MKDSANNEFKKERRRALRRSIKDIIDAVGEAIMGPDEKLEIYRIRLINAQDRFKAWWGYKSENVKNKISDWKDIDGLYLEGITQAAKNRWEKYLEAVLGDSDEAAKEYHQANDKWVQLIKERNELNRNQE